MSPESDIKNLIIDKQLTLYALRGWPAKDSVLISSPDGEEGEVAIDRTTGELTDTVKNPELRPLAAHIREKLKKETLFPPQLKDLGLDVDKEELMKADDYI